jgi:hypothetical protein
MITRRLGTLAVAVLLALGLGAVAATPAHAAYSSCPGNVANLVCLWTGLDGGGTRYGFVGVSGFCTNVTGSANNAAVSFWNRRGDDTPGTQTDDKHVQFYDSAGCTGTLLCADGPLTSCPGNLDSQASGEFDNMMNRPRRGGRIDHTRRISSIFYNNG